MKRPHLYKWFGKYLMLAEGGTEYGHMETMMRSDNPYGPFEVCPHNPILTHRDDMRDQIYCTGQCRYCGRSQWKLVACVPGSLTMLPRQQPGNDA